MAYDDPITLRMYRGEECLMSADIDCMPDGARLLECYETKRGDIVVLGHPAEDDESHNCDAMGCGSMTHVLHVIPKASVGTTINEYVCHWTETESGGWVRECDGDVWVSVYETPEDNCMPYCPMCGSSIVAHSLED